jgi:signal transduction histidine kinase/ligand-binding sensor domain-containing protein
MACRGFALDPRQPLSRYLRTTFTMEEGLPSNIVNAIAQAGGFLWLGTGGHLARFDGRHFLDIALRPDTPGILALATGRDGDLWVGTVHGIQRVARASLSQPGPFPAIQYMPKLRVATLYFSHGGVLWAGTATGLFRFGDGQFSPVVPDRAISRIEEMPDGHLLLVTDQGPIEWDGTRAFPRSDLMEKFAGPTGSVYHVHRDRTGALWVCTNRGLAREQAGKIEWFSVRGKDGKPEAAFRVFEEDSGTIWVAMQSGMHRVTGKDLEALLPSTGGRAIFEDQDGTLWFGTNGEGLVRVRTSLVRTFTRADGLPNESVTAVLAAHDGTLWAGNNCGGLSRFDGERFHIYAEAQGLTNSCVFSLSEAPNGDLWIATYGGGVFQFHDGRFTQYSTKTGLPSDAVRCVLAARDGSIWMVTSVGISCLRDGRIRTYTTSDGLSDRAVFNIYQDHAGTIWAGTYRGTDRLVGERFASLVRAPDGPIMMPLGEDAAGNLYVAGGDVDLARVEGDRLVNYNVLTDNGAMAPYRNDLWLAGASGIHRVDANRLRIWRPESDVPLDYSTFGRVDGVKSLIRSSGSPPSAITPDERLWVAAPEGLVMFDFGRLPPVAAKPVTYVGQASVDGHKASPGSELVLPPGPHHVELDFDSIELSAPDDTRLQFRLDGVDRKWLDAGPVHTAIYSMIPPGRHEFHVRATNRDGVWDRQGIVYWIDQMPHYYETGLFRTGLIVFGVLLVAVLYQFRLHQAAEKLQARMEGRLAERERIARDLHDTTLQGIQGLVLLFEAGTEKLAKTEPAREIFEKALDRAAKVIAEGRDRVSSLRNSLLEGKGLLEALVLVAEDLAHGTGIELHAGTQGTSRDLQPEIADEAYYIGKEALLNAFRHSGARRIDIQISYGRRELRLLCRDNGCGIEPSVLERGGRAGHWGLAGMRERAQKIEAKIEIVSHSATGTGILLIVPASTAYRQTSPWIFRYWFR